MTTKTVRVGLFARTQKQTAVPAVGLDSLPNLRLVWRRGTVYPHLRAWRGVGENSERRSFWQVGVMYRRTLHEKRPPVDAKQFPTVKKSIFSKEYVLRSHTNARQCKRKIISSRPIWFRLFKTCSRLHTRTVLFGVQLFFSSSFRRTTADAASGPNGLDGDGAHPAAAQKTYVGRERTTLAVRAQREGDGGQQWRE